MELKDRVAIVTGAAGTIGKGISRELAKEGMHVVVADMAKELVVNFAEEIKTMGLSALAVAVDVTSCESTMKMVQHVIKTFGRIDVLVNNAGIIRLAPLTEFKEEDWDRVMNVNLKGAFLCAQAVVPHMIEKKEGRIINISSVAAKRPGPLQTAYAASKHGLIGLAQVWTRELGEHNITVNTVCPGFVDSPMWEEHLGPALAPGFGCAPSDLVGNIAKAYMPLGRPQTAEDIGQGVAYFCRADNTSGQTLVIDGGHAMY